MTLHKGILRQIQWRKMLSLCHNNSLGVKFSLYAQRHDWRKIFPLGIKAIFAILRQSLHDPMPTSSLVSPNPISWRTCTVTTISFSSVGDIIVGAPAPKLDYFPETWSYMVVAGTLNLCAAANLFIFPSFTALTAARRASEEYFVVVFRLYERTMMHKRFPSNLPDLYGWG